MRFVCLSCRTKYQSRYSWCLTCHAEGLVVEIYERESSVLHVRERRRTTASAMVRQTWDVLDFPAAGGASRRPRRVGSACR